jgi:NitT/TauT family transport system substrate-binding protein
MRLTRRGFTLAALGAGLTGCGAPTQAAPGRPEQQRLRVSVLPVVDDATVFVAIASGYFAQEGLSVTPVPAVAGPDSLAKLASGSVDVAFSNYVSVILAQVRGARLRLIADGYGAARNVDVLAVPPDSTLRSPAALAGRRIAVNAPQYIGTLLTFSSVRAYGVSPRSLRLVTVPFAAMAGALRDKTVDAAWMTEPFFSEAAQELGATVLADTASGATENMPIAGYATTARFAAAAPRSFAAFQRAMRRAAIDAARRDTVRRVTPTYIPGLSRQTLAIMNLGTYPTSLNRARIQRVADLMHEFGMLSQPFDVGALL